MDSIINFFQMIVEYIGTTIQGFVNLFMMIPRAATFVFTSLAYVPAEVRAFAICAIGISIVFLILGR